MHVLNRESFDTLEAYSIVSTRSFAFEFSLRLFSASYCLYSLSPHLNTMHREVQILQFEITTIDILIARLVNPK